MLVIFFRSDATRCMKKSRIFCTDLLRSFSNSGAMSAQAEVIAVASCVAKATFLLSSIASSSFFARTSSMAALSGDLMSTLCGGLL